MAAGSGVGGGFFNTAAIRTIKTIIRNMEQK